MRYILYLFTMALLFVGGMLVGNMFLPERAATLSATVSVPPLSQDNPALQAVTRDITNRNLLILNDALKACPVVVNDEKDRLVNQIRLRLAIEDFELKKARLELEIAKNTDTNRPSAQFIKATEEYNTARLYAEQLADELFPKPVEKTADEDTASTDGQTAENIPTENADKATPAEEKTTAAETKSANKKAASNKKAAVSKK